MHPARDELYDEETTEWECHACGETFLVEVMVSHSWWTEKRDA